MSGRTSLEATSKQRRSNIEATTLARFNRRVRLALNRADNRARPPSPYLQSLVRNSCRTHHILEGPLGHQPGQRICGAPSRISNPSARTRVDIVGPEFPPRVPPSTHHPSCWALSCDPGPVSPEENRDGQHNRPVSGYHLRQRVSRHSSQVSRLRCGHIRRQTRFAHPFVTSWNSKRANSCSSNLPRGSETWPRNPCQSGPVSLWCGS